MPTASGSALKTEAEEKTRQSFYLSFACVLTGTSGSQLALSPPSRVASPLQPGILPSAGVLAAESGLDTGTQGALAPAQPLKLFCRAVAWQLCVTSMRPALSALSLPPGLSLSSFLSRESD